jgi:hypothetical protein
MFVRKTPLAEVFHSSPATAPEKVVACSVVNDQPVGNPKRKV